MQETTLERIVSNIDNVIVTAEELKQKIIHTAITKHEIDVERRRMWLYLTHIKLHTDRDEEA